MKNRGWISDGLSDTHTVTIEGAPERLTRGY
jgi:hypothetical protein